MLRIAQWLLVVAVVVIAYAVLQPSPPAASAYPSALQTYDAPTAWSAECKFPRICHNGQSCWVGTDPNEGCKSLGQTCIGCFI